MQNEIVKTLSSFEAGVNNGISPLLLERNQLANAMNATVRGTFIHPRPPFQKITLSAESETLIASAFALGKFQGGGYFRPRNGSGSILSAIAGRAFQFTPGTTTATVIERTVTADANPVDQPKAWFFQAEDWAIWTDGLSNPVFIDGTTSTRSNWSQPVPFSTTTTALIAAPAIGAQLVTNGLLTSMADLVEGDIITFPNKGTMQVVSMNAPNPGDLVLVNLTITPTGVGVASGTTVSWSHVGTQLPPGRMGAYGMGRVWLSLVDGQQFVAGDQVGGASGTQADNYRDAVLNVTENLFLVGGGNFSVPGGPGDIRAMIFPATMDVSLGQGPLQIFTPDKVFSCKSPVDRDTWQSVVNPILTQSVITNGGLSQEATLSANDDIITRAIDGIRSIKLSRASAETWGRTPISFEVHKQLDKDSDTLLGYTSAIVFDNRYLLTTQPKVSDAGVFWQALIPLNFDPVSSLRGKAPSIYDSLIWTGLNVFQLFVGQFGGVERAFALCWNETLGKLELYELLKSADEQKNDNGTSRIVWMGESYSMFIDPPNSKRQYKQLVDGEIYVKDMVGTVDFQVYWKPDQWPCWVPWHAWRECVSDGVLSNPGFRPRMGLGEPSAPMIDEESGEQLFCDTANDRPLREGYTFQVRIVVTGQCEVVGLSLKAVVAPEPEFAKPTCCPERVRTALIRQRVTSSENVFAILDVDDKAILDVNNKAILQK